MPPFYHLSSLHFTTFPLSLSQTNGGSSVPMISLDDIITVPAAEAGAASPAPASSGRRSDDQPAWWTPACAEAIDARGKAKKAFKRRGCNESMVAFKKARAVARRVIQEAKEAAGVVVRVSRG